MYAQNVQIQHKYYTTDDGLPHRTVNGITQDSLGFIWLATNKGICKFNGYTFENFNQKQGLKYAEIKSIHCISNEILWIEYKNIDENNIGVFNTKTLQTVSFFEYYKNKLPKAILKKTRRVVDGSNKFFFIELADTTGFVSFNNIGEFKYHDYKNKVLLLRADEQNNLYGFEAKSKSILKFNNTKKRIEPTPNSAYLLSSLSHHYFPYSQDYFFYSEGINSILVKGDSSINSKLRKLPTNYFCSTIDNKEYFVNDYIIYNSHTGKEICNFAQLNTNFQNNYSPILSRFIDKAGTIWLGFEFGLLQVTVLPKPFTNLLSNISIQNKTISVRGIIENSKKSVFVNTENMVQFAINLNSKTEKRRNVEEYYYAFCADKIGNTYYYSDKHTALYKIDEGGRHTEILKGKFKDWVWSMTLINEDEIWVGTENNGIHSINIKTKTSQPVKVNSFSELKNATIYQINKIDSNTIWICSNKGLLKASVTKGIIEQYCIESKNKYYIPTNKVVYCNIDANDTIWMATLDKGLMQLNSKTGFVATFANEQGMPTETIYAAYEDAQQNFWIPSDKGIIQFSKKLKEVVHIYNAKDGIASAEFNRIAHCRTSDSTIIFGGLNGITFFNPKNFYGTNNLHKHNLVVEDAKIYNGNSGSFSHIENSISRQEEIELNAYDRFISLQLALLTFSNVEHIQYVYKIDNSNDWIIQNNRTIQIAGLSWGKHTITIKAKNENGVWANNIITIKLNQLKPFYLQVWFIAMFFSLIGLAFFIYYKLKTRQLKEQKIVLEQLVSERTIELSDSKTELSNLLQQREVLLKEIHHRVKNNLAVISGLLELQSDNTQDEIAKTTLLEGTNRVRSIALIHQKLYQHENFASIELYEFVNDLYKQIASVMSSNKNNINFSNNVKNILIDIDTSIPLGLIINELITNSFKYAFTTTSCPVLIIEFEKINQDQYQFIYKDNGKGLPEDFDIKKAKSLGIRLINSLAKQLSGSLNYSRNGELSVFTITFKSLEARNKE